jgi:hypothetical protein
MSEPSAKGNGTARPAALDRLAASTTPAEFRPALDAAVALLPTAPHRALFRLLLDTIVARHHGRRDDPSSWLNFIATGSPTKAGKTLMAAGACRVFGFDFTSTRRIVADQTEKSLWGRHYSQGRGAMGFRPARVLSRPLLILDEWNKGATHVRRAVLRLLQGEAEVAGDDDEVVPVAPTIILLSNGNADLVPSEYLRRSVVLDMSALVGQLSDVPRIARPFLTALPRIDLDALDVPCGPLPEAITDEMFDALRAGLSETGYGFADEWALAHSVPGRAALTGLDRHDAALAVVGDYLDVAATVGETATAPGPLEPAPDAAARRLAVAEQEAHEREERRHARNEESTLRGVIGEAVDQLRQLRPDAASFAPADRAEAARVAAQLGAVIDMVSAADSIEELREVVEDHQAVIGAARELVRGLPAGDVIDVEAEPEELYRCGGCGGTFGIADLDWEGDVRAWCPQCGGDDLVEVDEEMQAPPAPRALPGGPSWERIGAQVGRVVLAGGLSPLLPDKGSCSMCRMGVWRCNLDGCPQPPQPVSRLTVRTP